MLSKTAFDDIIKQLKFNPNIDLFVAKLDKPKPKFV